ncbi:MarR family winged helix-turn-helix transcriptional regulator [Enemella evansiae]|nr:MarR family transcriptional regulator [Enemella evansiae]
MRSEQVLEELFRLTDALATDMSEFLAGHGLNTARAHLLWTLGTGGSRMQRWLSEELGYSPRHVTKLVDDLIGLGLAERTAHPEDRRAVLVALTGAGKDLTATFERRRATLAGELFDHLDDPGRTRLAATLRDISERLAAVIEEGSS